MTDQKKNADDAEPGTRRRLLKQAAGALPLVATIPSGAALARSSNVIGISQDYEAILNDKVLCLDVTNSNYEIYDSGVDIGVAPEVLQVSTISVDGKYYKYTGKKFTQLTAYEVCEQGGEIYHKQNGYWQKTTFPVGLDGRHGVFVSATALSSFAVEYPSKDI